MTALSYHRGLLIVAVDMGNGILAASTDQLHDWEINRQFGYCETPRLSLTAGLDLATVFQAPSFGEALAGLMDRWTPSTPLLQARPQAAVMSAIADSSH